MECRIIAMTGLHAIHVTVGIAIMPVLALLAWQSKFSHGNYNTIEIAAFGMVMMALFQRIASPASAVGALGVSALSSYIAAIVTNATRIAIAISLAARPSLVAGVSAAQLHRVEGITIYFGGLALLYELVRRFNRHPAPTLRES